MAIVEISEKDKIRAILSNNTALHLEALDENALGMDGIVTVFCEETRTDPSNYLVVRWGQKNLGLGSFAQLEAGRMTELEALMASFPLTRGRFDMTFPFWAAGAIGGAVVTGEIGAAACYGVKKGELRPSAVVRHCERLDDHSIIKPMFPKLADDTPAYVLALEGELQAVAAVTHLQNDEARVGVYTVEAARGRGFGRGSLTAVAEELIALGIAPTVQVDLSNETAVRMIEGAGFSQRVARLRTEVTGPKPESPPGLVQIGH